MLQPPIHFGLLVSFLRRKVRTIRNKKSVTTSQSITVWTVPCPLGPAARPSWPVTQ
jgi:hypothetical protein